MRRVAPFLLVGLLCQGCGGRSVAPTWPKAVAVAPAGERYSVLVAQDSAEALAQKVLVAMESGDAKFLMSIANPEEIEGLGLSSAKLASLDKMYLKEKSGYKNLGISDCRETNTGGLCTEVISDGPATFNVNCPVFRTGDGFRVNITTTILAALIQFRVHEYNRIAEGKPAVPVDNSRGLARRVYQGLRSSLEPLGFDGLMFGIDQKGHLKKTSWESLIRSIGRPRRTGGVPRREF